MAKPSVPPVSEVSSADLPETPVPVSPPTVVIRSELDSYISERLKEQPTSLAEALKRVEVMDLRPQHRMQLPPYFESFSMDTVGEQKGPYAFRWIGKTKRSIDDHLAKGWLIVNRAHFPNAPRYLFTASGAVELGDTLLAFLPAKQATAIRLRPSQLSQDRIKGRMTKMDADKVVMTGDTSSPHVYNPELGPESAETSETPVPGVLTDQRDF